MRLAAAIVLLGCASCLVVARNTSDERIVGGGVELNPVQMRRQVIDIKSLDGTIHVRASRPGECRRDEVMRYEVTHRKKLAIELRDDGKGVVSVLGVLLAPLSVPISAAVAVIERAVHRPHRSDRFSIVRGASTPCNHYQRMRIEIDLPSGGSLRTMTDGNGELALVIPASEPDRGRVLVSLGRESKTELVYYRTNALCETDRLARLEAALRTRLNRRALLTMIPRCGEITTGGDPQREAAWVLAREAVDASTRGDCKRVSGLDLAPFDPGLHALVVQEATECAVRARKPAP